MTDPLSRAFAALADQTRRDLVARLSLGPATVSELAAPFPMTIQAISKHLKVLEDAGLVSKTPDAQRRLVRLETEAFGRLTSWIDVHQRRAEEGYARLDELLTDLDPDTDRPADDPSTDERNPS